MTEPPQRPDPELNPALRQLREQTHDTAHSTPPPVESTSVQRHEGVAWPAIWVIVTIVCVAIAVYLIFF